MQLDLQLRQVKRRSRQSMQRLVHVIVYPLQKGNQPTARKRDNQSTQPNKACRKEERQHRKATKMIAYITTKGLFVGILIYRN